MFSFNLVFVAKFYAANISYILSVLDSVLKITLIKMLCKMRQIIYMAYNLSLYFDMSVPIRYAISVK